MDPDDDQANSNSPYPPTGQPAGGLDLTSRDLIAIGLAGVAALIIGLLAMTARPGTPDPGISLHEAGLATATDLPPWAVIPLTASPATATSTPRPTSTASPIPSTPTLTATPLPTATPTETATPTATPLPTATQTPGPPPPAQLNQPAEGSIVGATPLTVNWSASAGADGYRLSLRGSDGVEVITRDYTTDICNVSGCQDAIDAAGLPNGPYTWTVEAWNELGQSLSNEGSFTLAIAALPAFELGGQVTSQMAHPDLMRRAGMTWVKFQVSWPAMGANEVATLVERGHTQGFKVLLSVKGTLYPQSIDTAGYVAFLREVAGTRPDAIEVWNEMNLNTEWPVGQIDPAAYVQQMLAPAYTAIKTTSPGTIVITGALASTGVHDGVRVWSDAIYAAGMARAGATRYADCIGFHYNAGATSPRATEGHPADPGDAHYSWYLGPTIEVYRSTFPDKPLCLTEIGYLSGEGYPPLPTDWQWASGTSAEEQAQWLAESVDYVQELGNIPIMIVWNVDYPGWEPNGDPQGGFAILRPDGSCPACDRLGPLFATQ